MRQAVGHVLAVDHTIEIDDLCAIAIAYERFNQCVADTKRQVPARAEQARWRLAPGFSDWTTLLEAFHDLAEAFTRAADAFTAIEWRWGEPMPAGWDEAAAAMSAGTSACRRRRDGIMPRPA